MSSVELKISTKDWLIIVAVGALFGFLFSLVFYFLNPFLQQNSTIFFSVATSIIIALFASALITFSNRFILPKVNKRFWYLISFAFSFLSGFLGFMATFFLFSSKSFPIVELISPYWFQVAVILGFLTFLVGLILHLFIAMKYRNESIENRLLMSKLKALENELNPHFLFNALNSISELVYIDQKKSEFALIRLAAFLRNAIKQESLIPLYKELEMVATYIDIENIRFEDRIHLQVHIDKEIQNHMVPKFSIQLLVENAIKHGYQSNNLLVHVSNDKNTLHVSNNGKLSENFDFGTGLNNLKSRLELLGVGKLTHGIKDDKMLFSIHLEKEKQCE